MKALNTDNVITYLIEHQNETKAGFDSQIIGQMEAKVLGVYGDVLKKYAKELIKTNQEEEIIKLINDLPVNLYHEIDLLKGLLIDFVKISLDKRIILWDNYADEIINWATCDQTVCNSKIKKNEEEELWNFILTLINHSEKPFKVRFGIIFLMKYFLKEPYLDKIFNELKELTYGSYYIDMGVAWLLATSLINNYEKTSLFILECNNLNNFVYQKSWQKALESHRISDDKKVMIREYKKLRG